jgi:hypothetical protein
MSYHALDRRDPITPSPYRSDRTGSPPEVCDPMTRRTLARLREGLEAVASIDGDDVVGCARTGARPSPVAGRGFPSRHAAVVARLAGHYRARLRRYAPETAVSDLVVCDLGRAASDRPASGDRGVGVRGTR